MRETHMDGIYGIGGDDKSYYTTTHSLTFKKFIFLYNLNRIIEYIELLGVHESSPSLKAQELFSVLEGGDKLELKDSVIKCTELFFDILMNTLEENSDTTWIYSDTEISLKLSRQKETEKQELINDLEGKTSEQRTATMELQNAGLTNWFKDFSSKNLERIKGDKHTSDIEGERLDKIKELLARASDEGRVVPGVNTELLLHEHAQAQDLDGGPDREEEDDEDDEDAYDMRDMDREDEGDDDEDNDGDYSVG
tara:strand:- start:225 stop:980 length:756 start_codon:yes stop_codon:yes gene_type:complete